MDDPKWLRLIIVGLILATLLVGYMLLSGSFVKSKSVQKSTSTQTAVKSPAPQALPSIVPNSSTPSAYERIVDRSRDNFQTLPRTGFPLTAAMIFSLSAIISGWFLRKFSH